MNIIDILVLIILLWSLRSGWRSGILVQLSGIIGIVLGAWVAFRFTHAIGVWAGVGDLLPRGIMHAVVFVAVLWAVVWVCRLLTRTLRAGGLGTPIRALGAVFAVAKSLLILGLVLMALGAAAPWIDTVRAARAAQKGATGQAEQGETAPESPRLQTLIREAKSYETIKEIGEFVFPYIALGTQTLIEGIQAKDTVPDVADTGAAIQPQVKTSPTLENLPDSLPPEATGAIVADTLPEPIESQAGQAVRSNSPLRERFPTKL